ncbi:MAG TPA: hypothetical protein VMG10_12915 [Gemmataceae bacterium]|nr:hypothetical protein [Gemmataceae bacterium]
MTHSKRYKQIELAQLHGDITRIERTFSIAPRGHFDIVGGER